MIRVIIEELNIATKNDFNLNEICFLTRMKFESQKSRNINIVDLLIELPLLLEQQLPNKKEKSVAEQLCQNRSSLFKFLYAKFPHSSIFQKKKKKMGIEYKFF